MANPTLLITGASSGIGEASARHAAQAGYNVALAARSTQRLETLNEYGCGGLHLQRAVMGVAGAAGDIGR